ncbi:transcriptional regulator GutM [Propionispora hippei]|uniref:Glucitol operon activator protein n=1 Tax=Propionispora hippei DSM 15287 TaxID=1123003 RepID=A0A1M6JM20_9FIRM|nr:transcriptional regulator GutM [Propionispora hippei]SHJ47728.1 glucitol operon activator protein [Propionispora hippei DSM 15287]
MERFMLFLFVMYSLQMLLTYFQIKNLRKTLAESRQKGLVGMGSKKRKLTAGNIVVLVTDEAGDVVEGRMMKGFSVLARFKELPGVKGCNVARLKERVLAEPDKKRDVAMLEAIEQIERQLNKAEETEAAAECLA